MSTLVGKTIAGRYRVIEYLGRGGMADVYKVWDQQRSAYLAMKVLHEHLALDQVFIRRFRREAQNLAKLTHPNIVRFYELVREGELVFMLMEYVEGVTLSKARFRIGKPFTPSQALGIIQPICSALHFAHQIGLAHCDIKPGNIMIEKTGRVLLTDFGIARVTEGAATATMVGAGTPAYMSPEQAAGEDPTPQTDVYALGVVLFELLTGGERPFTGEQASVTGTMGEKIRWEQRNLSPPSPRKFNPEIAPQIEAVVMRCLSKDRRTRYGSVAKFLNELTQAVGSHVEALPPFVFTEDESSQTAIPVPSEKPARIKPIYIVGAVALILIACLVLGGGGLLMNFPNVPIGRKGATQPVSLQVSTVVVTKVVEVKITSAAGTNLISSPTESLPTNTPPPTSRPTTPISVKVKQESSGKYIYVTGGQENYNDRYGPLANGALKEEPSNEFCVYVDYLGYIYVIRYGDSSLHRLPTNVKDKFQALYKGQDPDFSLSIIENDTGTYVLVIRENLFGEQLDVQLPRDLTL